MLRTAPGSGMHERCAAKGALKQMKRRPEYRPPLIVFVVLLCRFQIVCNVLERICIERTG